jgi:hypothetical protein
MDHLPQDDQFLVLLHKKIMDKTGSAKRREKKYYMDQYRKPGSFQSRCCLPVKGSWRGASATVVNRSYAVKKRFVQMVKASTATYQIPALFSSLRRRGQSKLSSLA